MEFLSTVTCEGHNQNEKQARNMNQITVIQTQISIVCILVAKIIQRVP